MEKLSTNACCSTVSSPSEQVKGNGLGLAIVKAICQYHGCKVSYSYTGRHCFTVDFS